MFSLEYSDGFYNKKQYISFLWYYIEYFTFNSLMIRILHCLRTFHFPEVIINIFFVFYKSSFLNKWTKFKVIIHYL